MLPNLDLNIYQVVLENFPPYLLVDMEWLLKHSYSCFYNDINKIQINKLVPVILHLFKLINNLIWSGY